MAILGAFGHISRGRAKYFQHLVGRRLSVSLPLGWIPRACIASQDGSKVGNYHAIGRSRTEILGRSLSDQLKFEAEGTSGTNTKYPSYTFSSTFTSPASLFSARSCSSAVTSAGMRSGVELTSISIGPMASARSPKFTHIPIKGEVLICVFMPYEIAWPIASRHRNAAPLRTLATSS